MELNSIKNVKNSVNRLDVVNKDYADRIKYKTASANFPNICLTDHILFTFPIAKYFASGKIKICEVWVERLEDEWVATSSPMFATEWPGFHKFTRVRSLCHSSLGLLLAAGHGIFASTILKYREYIILVQYGERSNYFMNANS